MEIRAQSHVPGEIVALSVSARRTVRKTNVPRVEVVADHGIVGDAHAGPWHRQVSLLALESVERMRQKGLNVKPGDFAENITVVGLELPTLPVGTRLALGDAIIGEVTQIGKVCHTRCAIYYQAGDCVMPREGIFIRILRGGELRVGDTVRVLDGVAGDERGPTADEARDKAEREQDKPVRVAAFVDADGGPEPEEVEKALRSRGDRLVYWQRADAKAAAETAHRLMEQKLCDVAAIVFPDLKFVKLGA